MTDQSASSETAVQQKTEDPEREPKNIETRRISLFSNVYKVKPFTGNFVGKSDPLKHKNVRWTPVHSLVKKKTVSLPTPFWFQQKVFTSRS